ncbi:MAG: T9SS type A sorting domain-containing protein [Chlorobi bacterium]|nr:T9SS type A sorting domain-containing protein [Chlorobiota bacterium]
MKNITYLSFALLFVCNSIIAQNLNRQKAETYLQTKGEVCFVFTANNEEQFKEISSFLSIGHKVNRETLEIEAYANSETFKKFLSYGLPYKVNKSDNEFTPKNPNYAAAAGWDVTWDAYPTYSEYTAKMQYFASTYPTLCSLQSIGTTQNGRDIWVLKISDNVSTNEAEPEFLYSSTMHGDELAGFPLMIRLIDYLLSNYGTDTEVTNLVNSTEIYINPNANPDGSYRNAGNNTITNPIRANASGQDLNRNYPDNQNIGRINGNSSNTSRLHFSSTGGVYENETQAFMKFEVSRDIVLAANFHGGIELVNYAYDNTYSLHADQDFYEYISVEYATNAQTNSPGDPTYMTVDKDSGTFPSAGVTNGAAWYVVYGGRQDYMNFYRHAKEVTIELSDVKWISGAQLPNLWNYNKQALLDYIKQANYGFQGTVTDQSGNPVAAKVSISRDALNSWVTSNSDLGDYYKLIEAGTYSVTYEASGYISQTISVTVTNNTKTVQNVTLIATTSEPTANNVTINSGETASLTATGSGTINWYQNINNTSPVFTGSNYTTPVLTTDTSYFVEDVITKANVGSSDNTANGGFFAGGLTERYLVFDCTEPVKLSTVTINAQQAGEIEIQLQDSSGNMLDSRVIIVETAGIQQINLDFIIPVGTDMRLTSVEMSSGFNLHRNNTGVSYPYTNGSISIKNSNAGTGFYYFFYDWNIQDLKSSRKEVVVTVQGTLGLTNNILNDASVYPNPFNNSIEVKLPTNINTSDIELTLYDIRGRIFNINTQYNGSDNLKISDLQKLSTGTYLLKITDKISGLETVKKILKD